MGKILIKERDGKTLDERETCFPKGCENGQKRGACTR